MALTDIVAKVMSRCNLEPAKEMDVEEEVIAQAIEILELHRWRFLISTSTETTTDETDYALSGANDDAGEILYLEYEGRPLDWVEPEHYIREASTYHSEISKKSTWTVRSWNSDGHPIIELGWTVVEAGKTLTYESEESEYRGISGPYRPKQDLRNKRP